MLFLLDATQSMGQFPVDADDVCADLITATGRKFLRGPRGTGFLWVRESALDRLDPFVAEVGSATWDGARSFTWADGARRFESWENSYVNILGLGSAVRQALDLGLDQIGERATALGTGCDSSSRTCRTSPPTTSAWSAARSSPPASRTCPPPTLPQRWPTSASTSPPPSPEDNPFDTEDRGVHPLVRLSPHYYNTEDEIDRAVAAIDGLGG